MGPSLFFGESGFIDDKMSIDVMDIAEFGVMISITAAVFVPFQACYFGFIHTQDTVLERVKVVTEAGVFEREVGSHGIFLGKTFSKTFRNLSFSSFSVSRRFIWIRCWQPAVGQAIS